MSKSSDTVAVQTVAICAALVALAMYCLGYFL